MMKRKILNQEILSVSLNEFLENLNSGVVFTPNIDHLAKLQKDYKFYCAYKSADWVICDSRILQQASFFLKESIMEVIPGSSFLKHFYKYHKNSPEIKLFLLGAREGVSDIARFNINIAVGHEMVVGNYSPPFGFEFDEEENTRIINHINSTSATVLVVGLGAPKQEVWIINNRHRFVNIKIFLALGATIDFEANYIKRAPKLIQKLHLEWLYRLAKEPKRLWKRYLVDDLPVFYLFLLQKLGLYKDPFQFKNRM